MTVEQMRKAHSAKPFQPFVIHLADSRTLPVNHPEMMMFSQSGRTVVVSLPDDTFEIIDLLLVTSIRVPGHTNGSGKRRRST
jgi:hypothetical protein